MWKVGKYVKGEIVHSYEVTDTISSEKIDKYIIVAPTTKEANEYAKTRHKNRVKQHKGLARLALSLAMKAVYNKQGGIDESVSNETNKIATNNT